MEKILYNLKWEYSKWIQSIKVSLSKNVTYKINFILMMVVPIFVFFFIKYNLWVSIYEINSKEIIKGYTLSKMLQYQFGIFLFDMFVRSHFFSLGLAQDIRLGRISTFLLYPFHFIKYQLSLFISDKILQLIIGILSLSLALYFDFIAFKSLSFLLSFFCFTLIVTIYWFFIQTLIGLLAFWIEETWSLNLCIRFISAFLSGAFIPLDLYPEFLRNILIWTPFPYLIYFPVKILMGDSVPILFSITVISTWVIGLIFFTQWAWKKGLTLYTGAGM